MSYGKIDPKLLATVEVLQSRIIELEHQVKTYATRQKEITQDTAGRQQRREQNYDPTQARRQDFPQAPQGVIYRITPL